MAEAAQIKGTERAAILLMTLGEQTAASVLRHMDVEEVQRLGTAMAGLADVPRDRVTDVLGELLVAVQSKTSIGIGTSDYLRKVLTDSLGERRAGALLGRIVKGRDSTGIDALRWMEPRAVAEVIKGEHPQIDRRRMEPTACRVWLTVLSSSKLRTCERDELTVWSVAAAVAPGGGAATSGG